MKVVESKGMHVHTYLEVNIWFAENISLNIVLSIRSLFLVTAIH